MEIDTNKFPCHECITFVLCKNKEKLKCSILFNYIREKYKNDNHRDKVRLKELEKIFNKQVLIYRVHTEGSGLLQDETILNVVWVH